MLKQLLLSCLPIILGFLFLVIVEYFIGTAHGEPFNWESVPFAFFAFFPFQLFMFFRTKYKIKKMNIDMGDPKNQNGTITKTIELALSKEAIIECLKKHSWKFKIEQQEETAKGTLLKMKYYQLTSLEKIDLLIEPQANQQSLVSITSGARKAPFKFISFAYLWDASLKHIQYFIDVLDNQETVLAQRTVVPTA